MAFVLKHTACILYCFLSFSRSNCMLRSTYFAAAFAPRRLFASSAKNISRRAMTATATATTSPPTLEEHSPSYKDLLEKLRTITHLNNAATVLRYDQQVFMPPTAAASRGKQMAVLASIAHERATSPEIGELIEKAIVDLGELSATCGEGGEVKENEDLKTAKRILELEKKQFDKNTCIPSELAAKKASLEASANAAWVKARQTNDFSSFAPSLKDCFATAAEIATLQRGDSTEITLYSQMLDEFEMGMPAERIDSLFSTVQSTLVPLIAKIRASPNAPSLQPLSGKFPIDAQKEASRKIVGGIGFDENNGRIDVSVHPFTMALSGKDVRITSRFTEEEWYQGLMGTIHEGGHAMYEQNLPESELSVDSALSMGVHESQSLFWERHVGKSKEFYKWARPILVEAFDKDGEEFTYSSEELYGAVNAVDFTNLIRVDADELTYPLHVILRYNIERDVIAGDLDVDDIPARWNADMKEMLGVDVPNDASGCLQDIHWSFLAIGYFPTYLIGAIMAAQLSHYCKEDIPDMSDKIEAGEFEEIRKWLTKKVHMHGKRYKSLDELLLAEVGEELNPKYFIDYLTEKYTDLYKVD
mmetsp:Transcript_14393/g.24611  ORF Transcript_14393/g.24611 Transcript_14393/m.24611 type:complete len:588 (-) Transcript_14393:118-1881(-)